MKQALKKGALELATDSQLPTKQLSETEKILEKMHRL